jgi:mRNA interferase HigB
VNVISRPKILKAQRKHPRCRTWLDAWWRAAKRAHWVNLADVRLTYPTADQVGNLLVFDAPEARRLIVGIRYASREPRRGGTLFVKYLLTHAEYDRGDWKED